MKIRIKFSKTGTMKFIGHLDTMRFFQKVMRLSGIDICYSEGYSPHQIMSFASPLGVGVESIGEYLDIEVASSLSSEESLAALNRNMPEGLRCLSYRRLPDDARNAMSLVSCADYQVFRKDGSCGDMQEQIDRVFYGEKQFLITKKTKKSEIELNLREYVYDFAWRNDAFFLKLSAGSERNIKPELLLTSFFERQGLIYEGNLWQVRRLEVYGGSREDGFLSLEDYGTTI